MSTQIILVEDPEDWDFGDVGCPVVDADDYLTGQEYFKLRNVQVINLCGSYRYLSVAYYCSLLAEARGHRVIPMVKTMLNLSSKSMYSLDAVDLDDVVRKSFRRHRGDSALTVFELDVYFGQCRYPQLAELARQIFETFACPLLRITFERADQWHITAIKPRSVGRLKDDQRTFFIEALSGYLKRRWRSPKLRAPARYDLAILHNPDDPLPPSDKRALNNFIKAGAGVGVSVDLIQPRDYSRLAEYDALFIRDTTRINHYTYRFAKKAESEGMVVIDDPTSIRKCTNKVYLAELLRAKRIPAPKTVIAARQDLDAMEKAIGYPMVIKVPDGSFSQGVFKAQDRAGLNEISERLFKSSELILAQEFLYTEFDWRIGVLNRKPIYVSQYFMSKEHWQIVQYDGKGGFTEGAFRTWAVDEAPPDVLATAVKAANLIGDGLYGVDMKQNRDGVYVIEVNDNPNIDAGVEDAVIKGDLYRLIIEDFVRRLDARKAVN